jgi:hypothetical protein
MPGFTRLVLWSYLLFNLAIAATLFVDLRELDATYQGGAMTPTREFLWFSVASFHVLVAAVTLATLRLRRAAERRWFILANAGFYGWDALTQWLHWGAHVGLARGDLHVNAGVSAACGVLLVIAAYRDHSTASPG